MSTMKSFCKPPLGKSPISDRPRRVLRSTTTSVQSPPGTLMKSQKLNPGPTMEELDLRPEYSTISWEMRALANMVDTEFGKENKPTAEVMKNSNSNANSTSLFERGRFYDLYSAKRNERLKRRNGERGEEPKTPYNLGVNVESSKKKDMKKLESLRKSASAYYSVEKSEVPRYSLRSLSKENKKPPLPVVHYGKSVLASERKIGARRSTKI
ncbi:uncharacterized protein LOC126665084 [Mercurialis annua]|uniref:uncharacterized protein LOC126665084 n=1 Tax=Mercurialis annua TaxID=3986 RepID=UPI00215F2C9C|nr:uncharacterized protein LOC126665084 [Mercurialis annua]